MRRNSLEIEYVALSALSRNARSARRHSKKKVAQLAESIRRLGFNVPLILDRNNVVLAGHARLDAAGLAGMDQVPVIRVAHLNEIEARAFMLADNKFALTACWDFEVLASELKEIVDVGFDGVLTGFSVAEIDLAICSADEADAARASEAPENLIPEPPATPITIRGDVWALGRHRLLCGDARDPGDYAALLEGARADIIFADPPYNVPIPGHVSGLGKKVHGNFAMGCGEMSEQAFTEFLATTLGIAAKCSRDGALAFVCMDWRHIAELIAAGRRVFSEMKNLCVWNKTNGGMGAFYRSKHELIGVFKVGTAPHTNNFGLGATGRYRTNVWDYPGISSRSATRAEELEMHPTVKPVGLVRDTLKDCSRRGETVLDPFGGSGTTLIAAETCGRKACLIEFDPAYCDTIIARYEQLTGKSATLASSGETYEDVAIARAASSQGEAA